MEISRNDIIASIMKLRQAGKRLPQADRIKSASDRATEEQKVLGETIQLFSQLFLNKGISKDAWNRTLEKAMLRHDMNSSIITPGLMQTCLEEVKQEYASTIFNEDFIQDDYNENAEMRISGLSAIKWTFVTMKERAWLYADGVNAINQFKRNKHEIIESAMEMLGIGREVAEKYLVILMCWDNDIQYGLANGLKAKTFVGFDNENRLRLMYE